MIKCEAPGLSRELLFCSVSSIAFGVELLRQLYSLLFHEDGWFGGLTGWCAVNQRDILFSVDEQEQQQKQRQRRYTSRFGFACTPAFGRAEAALRRVWIPGLKSGPISEASATAKTGATAEASASAKAWGY
jgi:hypothetical protein